MGLFDDFTNVLTGGQQAAGNATAGVNSAANSFLQSIYGNAQTQENPFITSGTTANNTLSSILNGGNTSAMQPFFNSSTYQFPLQQGLQQISNNQAAQGLTNSTAALKNASQFTTGLASQDYQSFINNLLSLNTSGQQGIATQAGAGTGISSAVGNVANNQGNAAGQSASAPYADIGQGAALIGSFI